MAENFDLFGDPIPDNWGRRGRPQHIATTENINRVLMLLALGWCNERIANAIGITLPTFRKHYFSLVKSQRDVARDRLDSAYAMKLWSQVQEGNVGAMRLWLALVDRNDRMGAEAAMGSATEAPAAPTRPGKKFMDEQHAIDADADLAAELELEAAAQHAVN